MIMLSKIRLTFPAKCLIPNIFFAFTNCLSLRPRDTREETPDAPSDGPTWRLPLPLRTPLLLKVPLPLRKPLLFFPTDQKK